jgi:trehalose/maltose hydrolase-like predicted phosphorylase
MRNREMREWELIYTAWDPEEQPLREALCALGNGRFVTRGAFEEVRTGGPHCPGTYLAGGYNRLETEIAGRVVENEDLVNWPNWLPLTFRPEGGDWFSLDTVEVLDFTFRLDVYRGLLERRIRFRDSHDRESLLASRRIVHMAHPHLAAIDWTLKPLNWSGEIEIRSELDGTVLNENVARYQDLANQHLEVLGGGYDAEDIAFLTVCTNESRIRMSQAARVRAFLDGEPAATQRTREERSGRVVQRLLVTVEQNKELRVEKVAAIRTSGDFAISEPEIDALKDVRRAPGFEELLASHELRWQHLWSIADIELQGSDAETQLILRLHIFHLLQTVSPNTIDRDVGVPARGWHGEAYRGHIFWDELFIFPFLSLRIPEITRSLLMYRYRRLDEARYLAAECGYQGAMFPWQSGSDGREESQKLHLNPESGRWLPDESNLQRHVNAAIAYNVWRYHEATGDMDFLSSYGAELLVEISRFWASLATYRFEHDRYEIRGVMGPDEFHTRYPGCGEAGPRQQRIHQRDGRMGAALRQRLRWTFSTRSAEPSSSGRSGIEDEELARWDEVSRKMFIPFHGDGIISQFDGLRGAGGVRLGGLPRAVRQHPAAGPHPGGGGRRGEPLPGQQAGGRAHALLPLLPGGARGAVRAHGTDLRPGDDPSQHPLLHAAHVARVDAEPHRSLLGDGAHEPGAGLEALPGCASQRHRRHPGRDDPRGDPPGGDGRHGGSHAAVPHGTGHAGWSPLVRPVPAE